MGSNLCERLSLSMIDLFIGRTNRFDVWVSNNTLHLHLRLFYIEFSCMQLLHNRGPTLHTTDDEPSDATADEGYRAVPSYGQGGTGAVDRHLPVRGGTQPLLQDTARKGFKFPHC